MTLLLNSQTFQLPHSVSAASFLADQDWIRVVDFSVEGLSFSLIFIPGSYRTIISQQLVPARMISFAFRGAMTFPSQASTSIQNLIEFVSSFVINISVTRGYFLTI